MFKARKAALDLESKHELHTRIRRRVLIFVSWLPTITSVGIKATGHLLKWLGLIAFNLLRVSIALLGVLAACTPEDNDDEHLESISQKRKSRVGYDPDEYNVEKFLW